MFLYIWLLYLFLLSFLKSESAFDELLDIKCECLCILQVDGTLVWEGSSSKENCLVAMPYEKSFFFFFNCLKLFPVSSYHLAFLSIKKGYYSIIM